MVRLWKNQHALILLVGMQTDTVKSRICTRFFIHCNIVYNCKGLEITSIGLNKGVQPHSGIVYSYNKEWGEELCELICRDYQNILLSEKSNGRKSIYSMLTFV